MPPTKHQRAADRAAQRARVRAEEARRADRESRRDRRRAVIGRIARWGTAVIVVVVVVGAAGIFGDRGIRALMRPAPGHLPPITPAAAYMITYRETFPDIVRTEVDTVQRPFHSVSLTLSVPDGGIVTGDLTNDQGSWIYSTTEGWSLLDPGQQAAGNDPQPAYAIARGLHHGLARVLGTQTILGRTCTLVEVGSPLGEAMVRATGRNHVDVCLDESGVMLSYAWTLNGKVAQTKTATAFDLTPTITAATFASTTPPVPGAVVSTGDGPAAAAAAANGVAVTAQPLAAADIAQLTPAVVPPAGAVYHAGFVRVDASAQPPEITSSLLYLVGNELVSVDYSNGGGAPPGHRVGLAGGHSGYLQVDLDQTSVTVASSDGSVVDIVASDPALVLAFAHDLSFAAPPPVPPVSGGSGASGASGT